MYQVFLAVVTPLTSRDLINFSEWYDSDELCQLAAIYRITSDDIACPESANMFLPKNVESQELNGNTGSDFWPTGVQNGWEMEAMGQHDPSPPSIMSNMLTGISEDALYGYGNWILEDNFI
jgi:hypothetical protein